MEKVLYVVLMASRKLQHYFQSHNIIIPSSQPLKHILRNREASSRIGKWEAELNEFVIDFVHRSYIQSQALVDFISIVNFVTMKCGISIPQAEGSFSMQEQLFDAILPSVLPLLLTLGCYKLLKAGKSSVLVMLVIIAIGVIGGLTGILSV